MVGYRSLNRHDNAYQYTTMRMFIGMINVGISSRQWHAASPAWNTCTIEHVLYPLCYILLLSAISRLGGLVVKASASTAEGHRLADLVVKASTSGAEESGFESRLRRVFIPGRVIPVT